MCSDQPVIPPYLSKVYNGLGTRKQPFEHISAENNLDLLDHAYSMTKIFPLPVDCFDSQGPVDNLNEQLRL